MVQKRCVVLWQCSRFVRRLQFRVDLLVGYWRERKSYRPSICHFRELMLVGPCFAIWARPELQLLGHKRVVQLRRAVVMCVIPNIPFIEKHLVSRACSHSTLILSLDGKRTTCIMSFSQRIQKTKRSALWGSCFFYRYKSFSLIRTCLSCDFAEVTLTLMGMLSSVLGRLAFRNHLKLEFSLENLMFWVSLFIILAAFVGKWWWVPSTMKTCEKVKCTLVGKSSASIVNWENLPSSTQGRRRETYKILIQGQHF